jgi:hypothetical protein
MLLYPKDEEKRIFRNVEKCPSKQSCVMSHNACAVSFYVFNLSGINVVRGHIIRGGPPVWEFGEGLTSPHLEVHHTAKI